MTSKNDGVLSLAYDFAKRRGRLVMEDHHWSNMTACVAMFEEIDPAVSHIETFQLDRPDTIYMRLRGEWAAYDPARDD